MSIEDGNLIAKPGAAVKAANAAPIEADPREIQRLGLARQSSIARWVAVFIMVAVLIWVVLGPDRAYAPMARTLVFFFAGVSLALMTGAELANKLELRGPGFAITLVGAAAVACGTLLLLNHVSKPETSVVAVDVLDQRMQPMAIGYNTVAFTPTAGAASITYAVQGNTAFVIYPSDAGALFMSISYTGGGFYRGKIFRPVSNRLMVQLGPLKDGRGDLIAVK